MKERFIPASCRGEKCNICGEQAHHKVEEVIFDDDPTAWHELSFRDAQWYETKRVPARHPSTAYVCHNCFGKIMGRTTIPGFHDEVK